MKPLVAQAPFIGAVTVFFLNRPVWTYGCYSTNVCLAFAFFYPTLVAVNCGLLRAITVTKYNRCNKLYAV